MSGNSPYAAGGGLKTIVPLDARNAANCSCAPTTMGLHATCGKARGKAWEISRDRGIRTEEVVPVERNDILQAAGVDHVSRGSIPALPGPPLQISIRIGRGGMPVGGARRSSAA